MVRPKIVSDEKVLEVARNCFLEKGPQVSTQEIAQKTGISQATLFKRFKTKEDLFIAAVASKEILTNVVGLSIWLSTHPQKGPIEPQLTEMFQRLWALLVEILPRIIAMHNQRSLISPERFFSAMKKPPPLRVLEGIAGFVRRAKENGQIRADVDVDVLAMNLMGAMQGRVFFRLIMSQPGTGIEDDNVYIQDTVRNFCSGIVTQEFSQ
ncbi:MAG: TetR/AcrR family transcriptional regulator [Deltaproteobacteria bacterium]|nr:TetR/AcrR family transcriptional regulator [Deltaproteobacteria bacterium]